MDKAEIVSVSLDGLEADMVGQLITIFNIDIEEKLPSEVEEEMALIIEGRIKREITKKEIKKLKKEAKAKEQLLTFK